MNSRGSERAEEGSAITRRSSEVTSSGNQPSQGNQAGRIDLRQRTPYLVIVPKVLNILLRSGTTDIFTGCGKDATDEIDGACGVMGIGRYLLMQSN